MTTFYGTSVADRVKKLTEEQSPLMKQAAAQGNQQAARRGLLNSSMGVRAAQTAMIDRALPMAQQDADSAVKMQMQDKDQAHSKGLLQMEIGSREKMHGMDWAQRGEQFDKGYGLNREEFDWKKGSTDKEFDLKKQELEDQRYRFDKGFGLDEKRLEQDINQWQQNFNLTKDKYKTEIEQFDRKFDLDAQLQAAQLTMDDRRLTQAERETATGLINSTRQTAIQMMLSLAQMQDIPADQRKQLESNIANYITSQTTFIADMYANVDLGLGDTGLAETTPGLSNATADQPTETQATQTETVQTVPAQQPISESIKRLAEQSMNNLPEGYGVGSVSPNNPFKPIMSGGRNPRPRVSAEQIAWEIQYGNLKQLGANLPDYSL